MELAPVAEGFVLSGTLALGRDATSEQGQEHAQKAAQGPQCAERRALHDHVLSRALDRSTAPNRWEALDPVCAINSRGELAIDLGGGEVITFPPAQTLVVRRFLVGCTFLEAA